MNTHAILTEARTRLMYGWDQGGEQSANGYSISGALMLVSWGDYDQVTEAMDALYEALPFAFQLDCEKDAANEGVNVSLDDALEAFNDSGDRTLDDVLILFDSATKTLELAS